MIFSKNRRDIEDNIFEDQKRRMRTINIVFGILAFIVFNLIMYLMISS